MKESLRPCTAAVLNKIDAAESNQVRAVQALARERLWQADLRRW
jgi:hypothetical protein